MLYDSKINPFIAFPIFSEFFPRADVPFIPCGVFAQGLSFLHFMIYLSQKCCFDSLS
jgi:hypothetical protein